ncbi:MAG: hypothetical protein HFG41_01150 [Coprococcus sp.]|nr:hypothetical protein [Coprococcus sp.]
MKKKKLCGIAALIVGLSAALCFTACNKPSISEKLAEKNGGDEQAANDSEQEGGAKDEEEPKQERKWLRVQEEKYDQDGKLIYTLGWTYNDYGQILEETKTKDGEVTAHYTCGYDEEQVRNSQEGFDTIFYQNCTERQEYTYVFDEYGREASRHEICEKTYQPGEETRNGTWEYDYTYFIDAAGTKLGYVKGQTGQEPTKAMLYNYQQIETEESRDENGLVTKKAEGNRVHEYEYDANGNVTKETYTANVGTNSEFQEVYIYSYEEKLVKPVKEKKPEGAAKELEVMWQTIERDTDGNYVAGYNFIYDDRGRQIAVVNGNDLTEYREYDENDNVIRVYTQGMVTDMIYDEAGRRVREEFREKVGGEIVMYGECESDKDGNVVRSVTHVVDDFYESSEGFAREDEYKDNRLLSTKYYRGDKSFDRSEAYEYDKDGKIVSVTYYDADGNVKGTSIPEYATIQVFE